MTICYFTATGKCLYVSRRIGGSLLSIPQIKRQKENVIEDDAGKVNTQHCHEQGKVRKNLKPIMGAEGKEYAFFCWGGTNA